MTRTKSQKNRAKQARSKLVSSKRQIVPVQTIIKASKRRTGKPVTMLARSIVNPFLTGACIPDGVKGTGCFSVKLNLSLSTQAAGNVAILVNADPSNQWFASAGTGAYGSGFSFPTGNLWSQALQYPAILNLYARIRPVSMGMRIYYQGSTMNDQGTIVVAQFPGPVLPYSLNGTNLGSTAASVFTLAQWYKAGAVRDGATITWRPEDTEDFEFFNAATQNVTMGTQTPTATPWIGVFCDGLAATTSSIRVEAIINYEGLYNNTQFTPGTQLTPIAAEAGWFENTMNAIRSVTPFASTVATVGASAMLHGMIQSSAGYAGRRLITGG